MATSAIHKIKHKACSRDARIKHEAKPSALLGIKAAHTECFILCTIARLGHASTVLKDLPMGIAKTRSRSRSRSRSFSLKPGAATYRNSKICRNIEYR